jgi:MoaA/NifB/PqqE/SkfB family radical SAM enzyme
MLLSDVKKIELEISSDCNAECPLCARTYAKMPLRGNNNITLQDIKRLFPNRQSIEDKIFKLCGVLGDPILNPECLEICEWFGNHNARKIEISTNGGYNNPEWWCRLATIKNVVVCFSVDGFENTNHIYRVNVKWNTVTRNMKAYSETGGKAQWVYITFSHNEEDFDKAKQMAQELNFDFVKRTSGRNILHSKKHKSNKMIKEVNIVASDKNPHSKDNLKSLQFEKNKDNIEILKDRVKTISCKHFYEPEIYIAADMTLWPCCYIHSELISPRKQVIINSTDIKKHDLTNNTIDQVLQSDYFKTIKQRWYADNENYHQRCLKQCSLNEAYANKKQLVK